MLIEVQIRMVELGLGYDKEGKAEVDGHMLAWREAETGGLKDTVDE